MRHARWATLGAGLSLAVTTAVVPSVSHAGAACPADWPMFQHDQARTASGSCGGLTPLSVPTLLPAWFVPTGGQVTAEPAVVGGSAYIGDGSGVMHAIDMRDGAQRWSFDVTSNPLHVDRHAVSYGIITSSAAVADVPSLGSTVFFGGGGSVYAVDATTGAPRWATDVDPAHPTSSAEVESSPVVWRRGPHDSVVFVGMDTNEDRNVTHGGVLALNATTGALLWKYDAESNSVVDTLSSAQDSKACGDVWSSPALDPARAMLFFGGGNCKQPDGTDSQRLIAVDARRGSRIWQFVEPAANHGRDQDFGASPVLTTVEGRPVVVQAGKSGWIYCLDRASGALLRSVHAAEGNAIGGFIGSVAVSTENGNPVLFGDTAIPVNTDPSVDPSTTQDVLRAASLHAVDLARGTVLWHDPAQTPSYAPTTVANGVVFAPDTTAFAVRAYDAATGAPLWQVPVAAATSGGVALVGDAVVFGVGTYISGALPPQVTGIWCFRLPGDA